MCISVFLIIKHTNTIDSCFSLYHITIYSIAQNSGREKLWKISDFKVLARKTLTNARHLYYWQKKNFNEFEGELSFVTH